MTPKPLITSSLTAILIMALAACTQTVVPTPDSTSAPTTSITAPGNAHAIPTKPGETGSAPEAKLKTLAGKTETIKQLDQNALLCGADTYFGQGFTATATGKLVSVAFAPGGATISNRTLTVRDNYYFGPVLHSQNIASFADSGGNLVTYTLTTPVQVVSGQQYSFDVDVSCFSQGMYGTNFSSYNGGAAYTRNAINGSVDVKFEVTIDPEPDTSITVKPPALTNSTSANFQFSDPGSSSSSFECRLDSAAFAACSNPKDFTGLSEGSHTLEVRSVDGDGDKDASPASHTWVVDLTKPTITAAVLTPPNANGWYNGDVTVRFACADNLSGVVSCPPDQTLSGEGNAISSTAQTITDKAGNTSNPSNVVTVKIDKTAPTLNPSVTPNPIIQYLSVTANPNASDAVSGIASASCAMPNTSSTGGATVTCTATDKAGNTRSSAASYTVISAGQAIDALSSQVMGLNLHHIQKEWLLAQLRAVKYAISRKDQRATVQLLNAFIWLVSKSQGSPRGLSNAVAEALVGQARLIIQSVQVGL